jgi:hypothetical protein
VREMLTVLRGDERKKREKEPATRRGAASRGSIEGGGEERGGVLSSHLSHFSFGLLCH